MFDPGMLLEIVKELRKLKGVNHEARFRTAIGRCYYKSFLMTLEKLRGKIIKFTDDSQISSEVRDSLHRIRKSNIASILDSLFRNQVEIN